MSINNIYPIERYKYYNKLLGSEQLAKFKAVYKLGITALKDNVYKAYTDPKCNTFAEMVLREHTDATAVDLAQIFSWNTTKQIYRFDEDLWESICSIKHFKIHPKIFESMPFNSLYIEHPINCFEGAMVLRDTNIITISFVSTKHTQASYIAFSLQNIEDVEQMLKESAVEDENVPEWYKLCVRNIISAIMYICSDVPDISTYKSPVPNLTRTKGKSKKSSNKEYISINTTGIKIGKVLREYRRKSHPIADSSTSTHTHGSPKSPHLRQAHYHSFWVGSRDGDRKLIVKFIPAIFVNGAGEDSLGVTIREQHE